jgi:hypothetical protein
MLARACSSVFLPVHLPTMIPAAVHSKKPLQSVVQRCLHTSNPLSAAPFAPSTPFWNHYKASFYSLYKNDPFNGEIGLITSTRISDQKAKALAHRISLRGASGCNIHGILLNRVGPAQNCPVSALHVSWNAFFQKQNPNAHYLQICQGDGAQFVQQALVTFDPGLRNRILVLAMSPSKLIAPELCRRVRNYAIANHSFQTKHEIVCLNPRARGASGALLKSVIQDVQSYIREHCVQTKSA